ncbi:MAG TPA: sulfatase-like hydrolase/transferase [Candidatus Latescibacteria bacterium]|jgi:arylsulfatase A-like enzyme|nr:arylsulfatase [Gemmatimonadaceae bacterium]MDP6014883.1 sulfatase-like hydrolase/transferase [Candidatus Latescibacterota bacterium]HJP33944.1 sulfatase-like hydrolase/transferase [Candidatus Latescibacterota bacterium]
MAGPQQGRRPNVVVFFTDQQRWDTTGLHGNPMELTPNLDRLARSHTHVAHSFTCQPVCGPARSCLQTGLYATTTGCYRNAIPLPDDARTLAHHFGDAGYDTGYIGKWHLHEKQTRGPVPAESRFGYDHWLASNILEFTSDAYDTVMYDNDDNEVKLPGYRVDAVTDAVIRYIDSHQQDPFFLFASYIEPHHQNHIDDYPPPDGYRERYTGGWIPPDLAALGGSTHQHLGGYYGMVKRLDEAYGRVHDALKSLALDQDTIVLFTSDHGSHFKTRNSEYKRSCHDSSIRVPTAFTGPGFHGGGEIQQLVSLIDLPPTLLDAAGLDVPDQMQGRSILPLLHGQKGDEEDSWPEEVFVQISEAQTGRAVRTHRWKYGVDAGAGVKEAWAPSFHEQYLYDLQADPYELANLIHAESHRPVADVMRQRLLRRMAEAGEQLPDIVPADVTAASQRRVEASEANQ